MTGTVVSSISLTIESAGGRARPAWARSAATTALGNVSKFGALPTDFTRTRGATDWTLSSTIGVTVVKANSISTAYTLNAKLATAPTAGIAWKVNAVAAQRDDGAGADRGRRLGLDAHVRLGHRDPGLACATATALDNTIMFDAISG